MHNYDHKAIEAKWQKRWEEAGIYRTVDSAPGKENYYALVEFPYPSGNLHIGHWYAFAVPDIFARYKRMNGYNVLFPFGFDSFGLPAENAAIKNKLDPREWTYSNIEHMSNQVRSMGNSFDWSRKVVTSDPDYYRWTQWMFLQFFKKDFAYRATELANWCPSCQTVLANEQVKNGFCERCGTEVEKREQATWFLKITDYAERLLSGLDDLNWPEEIKESQRNWIGKSEGAILKFQIQNDKSQINSKSENQNLKQDVEVFTTRPDTLFGATYIVLAPEHPMVEQLKNSIENWPDVESYIKKAQATKDIERTAEGREKTGVKLEGVVAINPGTKEEIPIFIADYVLAHYGTGAIMAVPAHDARDYAFAQKFDLPIRAVIEPKFIATSGDSAVHEEEEYVQRDAVCVVVRNPKDDTYLTISWKEVVMNGLVTGGIEPGEDVVEAAKREVLEETGYKNLKLMSEPDISIHSLFYHRIKKHNRWAHFKYVFFDLVDEERDSVAKEEESLHSILWVTKDELKDHFTVIEGSFVADLILNPDYVFTGQGVLSKSEQFTGLESEEAKQKITEAVGGRMQATYKLRDWSLSRQRYWGAPIPIVYDPEGKPHAVPNEHLPWTLPDDVDFTPTGEAPLARSQELKDRTEKIFGAGWTPEVDTFDTFIDSSWYFLRYADPKNDTAFASPERLKNWMPVDRYSGGAEHTTMHVLYSRFWQKALFDLGLVADDEPYKERMNRGQILGPDGKKMSKSKGNVVDPDEHVARVGADTVRLYLAFMGPYNIPGNYPFDLGGVAGMRRFLERIVRLTSKIEESNSSISEDSERLLHQTIKKAGEDINAYKFNTAISQIMILVNALEKEENLDRSTCEILLQLIAPFAPHLADELWEQAGHATSIHVSEWPVFDEQKLISDTVVIAIQVNGKMRGTITVAADATQADIEAQALSEPSVAKWLTCEPSRFIYVPGKIINIIVAS